MRDNGGTPRGATNRRNEASRRQLLRRIVTEYEEMPCLRVTAPQAQRLFGLRGDVCLRVLTALVTEGALRRDEDGTFRRARSI